MRDNQYATIAATFDELIRRLQEYGDAFPPPGCKGIRFAFPDQMYVFDSGPSGGWTATAHCYSRWETNEPLFLVVGHEAKASCRVRTRCVEPRIKGWFEVMLDWLAPKWDTDEVQPLPAVPLIGATAPVLPVEPEPGAPPKRRRGPKPGKTPEEMEAICVEWLEKAQFVDEMWLFCDKHRISEDALKKALRAREERIKKGLPPI